MELPRQGNGSKLGAECGTGATPSWTRRVPRPTALSGRGYFDRMRAAVQPLLAPFTPVQLVCLITEMLDEYPAKVIRAREVPVE